MRVIERLVITASAPEIAMPCPTRPSLTARSCDNGDNRLTGMNSEAMSANTHSVIAHTPPQCASLCRGEQSVVSVEVMLCPVSLFAVLMNSGNFTVSLYID